MPDRIINVESLSKIYKLYGKPVDRMKEALHPLRKQYHRDFYAINDVSFSVNKGETIGVIGKNGSGKSTLLKVLTGVLTPTSGRVEVKGRVSALLELGAGFNPEFSGLENVYFNGSIMGFTRGEMDAKIDDILSFADIGDFVHQPVKMYSSGMFVRLAFALAVNVDPDILIVDEALSVGDIRFQLKSMRRMQEIQENGATFLFVSHSMESVKRLCRRAVWLDDGTLRREGEAKIVAEEFHALMCHDAATNIRENKEPIEVYGGGEDSLDPIPENANINGEGGVEILGAGLFLKNTSKKVYAVKGGEDVEFRYKFKSSVTIETPLIGFIVYDRNGQALFGANSFVLGKQYDRMNPGTVVDVAFGFVFPRFRSGDYVISIGIGDGNLKEHVRLVLVLDAYILSIDQNNRMNPGLLFQLDDVDLDIALQGKYNRG